MRFLSLILLAATSIAFGAPKQNQAQKAALSNPTSEALGCVSEKEGTYLVLKKSATRLNLLQDLQTCEIVVKTAKEGVYCRYHRDDTTLNKDAKQLLGWFPTSLKSGKGIGHCPVQDLKVCLDVVSRASNGIVCTNSCAGWSVTNTSTQELCGSSVTQDRCLKASEGAVKDWVCSYTGDGVGANDHWVTTRTNPRCTYEGSHQSLDDCKTALLKKQWRNIASPPTLSPPDGTVD